MRPNTLLNAAFPPLRLASIPPRRQYTDEIADEHTRSVLLRGGSNYRPDGSQTSFPPKSVNGVSSRLPS